MDTDDLLHVYKCFLLPIIDYASVVYHPLLTATQSNEIVRLQSAALKIVYGWEKSYQTLLEENEIEYVSQRRQKLTDKFILKTVSNPVYRERWFPIKEFIHHDLRKEKYYQEMHAKTDRLYKSPIYYYRRRLNEIHNPD